MENIYKELIDIKIRLDAMKSATDKAYNYAHYINLENWETVATLEDYQSMDNTKVDNSALDKAYMDYELSNNQEMYYSNLADLLDGLTDKIGNAIADIDEYNNK